MSEYKETFKQTDQVVYDVLSWFSNSKRAWEPYTPKQLTVMVAGDRDKMQHLDNEVERLNQIINQQADEIVNLECAMGEQDD